MSTLFLSVWMGFLAVSAAARPQETAPQGGAAEPDRRPYRTVLKDDVFTLRFDLPNHQPSPVVDVSAAVAGSIARLAPLVGIAEVQLLEGKAVMLQQKKKPKKKNLKRKRYVFHF